MKNVDTVMYPVKNIANTKLAKKPQFVLHNSFEKSLAKLTLKPSNHTQFGAVDISTLSQRQHQQWLKVPVIILPRIRVDGKAFKYRIHADTDLMSSVILQLFFELLIRFLSHTQPD